MLVLCGLVHRAWASTWPCTFCVELDYALKANAAIKWLIKTNDTGIVPNFFLKFKGVKHLANFGSLR